MPADATKVADAIVRVFSAHGDRTNRNKARMKYVLDAMGFDKYLALVEEKLGTKLTRVQAEASRSHPASRATSATSAPSERREGIVVVISTPIRRDPRGLSSLVLADRCRHI